MFAMTVSIVITILCSFPVKKAYNFSDGAKRDHLIPDWCVICLRGNGSLCFALLVSTYFNSILTKSWLIF